MRLINVVLISTLLFSTAAMSSIAAPRGLSPKDLVMMERVSAPAFSPDGSQILYTVRQTDYAANKAITGLWLLPTQGRQAKRLTPPEMSIASPSWSIDGKSIYFLSAKSDSMQLYRVSIDGGQPQQLSSFAADIGSYKVAPDGKSIALSFEVFTDCDSLKCTADRLKAEAETPASAQVYDRIFVRHWDTWKDGRFNQLFVSAFDPQGKLTAEPKRISVDIDGDVPGKPFGDENDYAWSPDSKSLVFSVRIAGKTEPWSTNFDIYNVAADGTSKPVNLTVDNLASDVGPLFSADGKTLYYRAMKRAGFEADRYGLIALDLASNQRREIAADWDRSFDTLKWDAQKRSLLTVALDTGEHSLFMVNLAQDRVLPVADSPFAIEGNVSSFDLYEGMLVYAQDTINQPTKLYLKDTNGKIKTRQLTDLNTQLLADVRMGDYEQFNFTGWNDETVYGYVIKPWNYKKGTRYPVAFLIHGGPQGSFHNQWHYRWNAQTYAGAGFAVVMIDFHGSTGYGQKFTDSISGDWGGKPLEDLQKGWAAARQKYPFLDGERACALGGSYGGFMVNWIAGNWNEPWRCFVSHAGVFDNRMMGYATEELWFTEWEFGGPPWKNPQGYEKFNPVNHVDKWRVPILVIHGQKDYRVLVEQGIAAFTAAQRRGIESRFVYFPDENHWILKPHNSVLWHEEVNAWLKRFTETDSTTK